ncbi:MAG: DUF1513 domain-containing protein [Methylobacterium mesophilicum]|nr:DUF1513 domain-containing protein [Methylobacterium mesophilicum]
MLLARRDFLRGAGALYLASLGTRARAGVEEADALFATAFQRKSGGHGVAIMGEDGKPIHLVDLPDRGHDIVFDPVSRRSVVFARQPGTFALVFSHEKKSEPLLIASRPDRHFFGHGAFSPDGRILWATENDFEAAQGTIGIYDVQAGFKRVGEFPTGGIGPHECLLMPDGKTLAVANGGIETHPDYGREELNLSTMKPSLAFIDTGSGQVLENHGLEPKLHQLSIRHMDLDANGTIWFGCQHRGPLTERPALVGRASRGKDLDLIELPEDALFGLRNYVGSVAANRKAGTVAVSSPQGNSWLEIDAATGRLKAQRTVTEVCGLAPDHDGFLATTGMGAVLKPEGDEARLPDYAWDNHVLRIG